MAKTYIVIVGHIVGSPATRYVTVWNSDGEQRESIAAARSYGFQSVGCDDFRIGELVGGRLNRLMWMTEERIFEAEEITNTAEQLGLQLTKEAA